MTVVEVVRARRGAKQTVQLFASRPQAGFPSPGDDEVEKALDLNDLLIDHPAATFFVRVSGDSMEDAGIFDGDILVVDRSEEPKEGRIVIAAVYGELAVKRLRRIDGELALVSENPNYKPIFIHESDDVFLWGVVTGSVRTF